MEIWRRGGTEEISGFPFIMGFLGGSFWLRYGLLKHDFTMISVNAVGVALMFTYILFFVYFSQPRVRVQLCKVGSQFIFNTNQFIV